jgi:hypothetical protein
LTVTHEVQEGIRLCRHALAEGVQRRLSDRIVAVGQDVTGDPPKGNSQAGHGGVDLEGLQTITLQTIRAGCQHQGPQITTADRGESPVGQAG